MQRFPIRKSSSAQWLLASVGIGALAACVLSSPRRRAAVSAASRSALDAASRLVTASTESLRSGQPDGTGQLANSLEKATAKQRETFRDKANDEKMVEIGPDKTLAPIRGLDAPERPGR